METETVERVEHMARGFAVVLVSLLGIQNLCQEISDQMGVFASFGALACVGLSWHARLVRGVLAQHPKVFVATAAICAAAMTVAFMATGPAQTVACHLR